MLLVTFMKKKKYDFKQATNGLLSVQAVQDSGFDFDIILMGAHISCTPHHVL